MATDNLVATPAPLNGEYTAGQTVEFCYTVSNYNNLSTNWHIGIGVQLGAGWNAASLSPIGQPASQDGNGTWLWTSNVTGSATGQNAPYWGWYYDSSSGGPLDGNPGNNFGDCCGGPWTYCFSVTTSSCPPGTNGADLGITVHNYADGEIGSWTNFDCGGDANYVFNANLSCISCGTPDAVVVQNESCPGDANGEATVTMTGGAPPFTYSWNTVPVQTTQTASGLIAGNYAVTVTDANQCVVTDNVTITVGNGSDATINDINLTNTLCLNDAPTQITTIQAGGTFSGTGVNATGLFDPSTANNGVNTITYSIGGNCPDSQTLDITVIPNADATINDINLTNQVCTGSNPAQLTAATLGGTWTGNGVSATGMFDPMAAGVGLHTVTYTIADPCGDIGTLDITVDDLTASSSSTASVCTANNGTATVTPLTGTPPYDYNWTSTPIQTTQTATDLAPADYDVTIQDATGCSFVTTVTVPFDPSNLTGTSSATAAICTAENGTATLTPVGGTAPYTHFWSTSPVQNTATAIDLTAGDYDVTLTDANGCEYQETITVTFDPSNLTVSIPASQDAQCFAACDGESTAVEMGGTAPYLYAWDDPSNQLTAQATGLCAGTFNVGVADANGCLATAQIVINEPTEVTVSAVLDVESNCGNPDGEVTATALGGTIAAGHTYSWDSTPMQNTATATGLAPATYTVTASDDNGCTATASVDVTATQGFTASISSSTDATCNQICDGEASVTTTPGSTGVLTYDWNSTPPQILPDATNLCAGTYQVTVTDGVGCVATADVTITEPTAVSVSVASSVSQICIGETADLTGTVTGGTAPYSGYTWVANPADPSLNSSEQNPTVSPIVTTEYTFTAQDASGCISAPKFVEVVVLPPLSLNYTRPLLSPTGDTAICRFESATIDLQASGGDGNYTYFLDPDNQNPVPLPLVVSPATTTSYTFTVVDGCTTPPVSLTNTVTVNQLPVVNFTGDDLAGCDEHTVAFTDATTPIPVAWNWDFGDSNSSANSSVAQSPNHIFSGPGLYSINLEATTAEGCSNDTSRSNYIEVFPVPYANFELTPEKVNVLNATIEFTDLSAPDISTWDWNFGDGDISDLENPIHTYTDTGIYTIWLNVETIHGCVDDVSRTVEIDPDFMFYVPNAFTPNGDEKNDVFRPYGEGVKWDTFEMTIYNRWGEEIYYTADINSPWRGWFKNRPVEVGTYVYKIQVFDQDGEKHTYRDGVTLVR